MKKLSDLLKASESVETTETTSADESIEKISQNTQTPIEVVCESVEEGNKKDIDAIIETFNYHKKEAEKLKTIVDNFIAKNKEIEAEAIKKAEADEDPLKAIGVTPETHPEIFGKWSFKLINENAEIPFGEENKLDSHKLFDELVKS